MARRGTGSVKAQERRSRDHRGVGWRFGSANGVRRLKTFSAFFGRSVQRCAGGRRRWLDRGRSGYRWNIQRRRRNRSGPRHYGNIRGRRRGRPDRGRRDQRRSAHSAETIALCIVIAAPCAAHAALLNAYKQLNYGTIFRRVRCRFFSTRSGHFLFERKPGSFACASGAQKDQGPSLRAG